MKYYSTLLLLMCLGCMLETDFDPLIWKGHNIFGCKVQTKQGWSIGIRPTEEEFSNLLQLSDFDVDFAIVNSGQNALWVQWRADNVEERKAGKVVIDYGDYEMREMLLMPKEKLLWYSGKMRDLVPYKTLSVGTPESSPRQIHFLLQLEFKEIEKLKDLIDISTLAIPISGKKSL